MRLWSIDPTYLDAKGLVALWREGLLAKNVLEGKTKGYKNHPQLQRFKESSDPIYYINEYLHFVADEADKRGYSFNRSKLISSTNITSVKIKVTNGQIDYEFKHLLKKLKVRDLDQFSKIQKTKKIQIHPLFKKVRGDIEDWEVISNEP